jgi:RHS repeat-associated protein
MGARHRRLDVRARVTGLRRVTLPGHRLLTLGLACALVVTSLPLQPASPAAAATGDPFRFIYDELGRLVAAVTPTDSARYTYDAVGNITAITRQAATTLTVIEFAPHAGPTTTTVTIYGKAFSPTPSQNTVKFNGTTATVTSSTTTQIVTTVPAGATTGTISVKVGNTTATSTAPFTVGSTAPTITGFSPSIVNPGDTVTVNGTNFDAATYTNDATTFNNTYAVVTGANATALTTKVPPMSGSGPVVVRTPNGMATSSGDLFIAPTGFTAVQVGPTARVPPGQGQTLNFTVAGKIGLLLISVNAGQHLVLTITNSLSSTYNLTIRDPDGAALYGPMCCSVTYAEIGPVSTTGTYTAVFDPAPTGTGSVTANAYAAADLSTAVVPTPAGATAALTTTTPGQNMSFTFSGTLGQRVSLSLVYSGELTSYTATVKDPLAAAIFGPVCCNTTWIEIAVLLAGTYTVVIDPTTSQIGTLTLTAYDVPVDPTTSVTPTPAGATVALTTTTPGQNMSFTFSGTPGQRVSLGLVHSGALTNYTTTVKDPNSTAIYGPVCCDSSWIELSLTPSGTYTVFVDPSLVQMGTITLTAYNVPADPTTSVTPTAGGATAALTTTTPGQNMSFTFSGTLGQRISLSLVYSGGLTNYTTTVKDPNSATIFGPNCCNATWIELSLLLSGTYTIAIDPTLAQIGTLTLTAYDVPADPTTSVTPTAGGATVALTTTTPGQNMSFTFSGTSGQRISLSLVYSGGLTNYTTTVKDPSSAAIFGPNCCNATWIELSLLLTTGTYTIAIDPTLAQVGTMTLTAYDVPADLSAPLTIGGGANLTTTTPGQNMNFTFAGTATHTLNVTLTASGGLTNYTTTVKNPDGSTLWGPNCCSATSIQVGITQTGTHTIVIDPSLNQTGRIDASLISALGPFAPTLAAADGPRPGLAARVVSDAARAAASPWVSPRPVPSFKPPRESPEWIPDASARTSWTVHGPDSPWRSEPLPEADAGVTALAGQILALNGQPLEGIAVSLGDVAATTDRSGQFLLIAVAAGVQELLVDGGLTRGGGSTPHGIFAINVTISEGGTNRLPYTIWLPTLDTAHTLRISSPTDREIVLTTPHIPDLEVHIPAGTTITDEDGEPVTEIAITAIPLDRTPFPLPGLQEIPVYFTIQPGGAYLSKKARIVYPNYTNLPPGTREDFWSYDPEDRGWHVYGRGQVTPDGKQVVPDDGIGIYEFSGAMLGGALDPPAIFRVIGTFLSGGDPVDLGTGLFILDKTDLALPDTMPLSLTRTYRQSDTVQRAFGIGTSHAYGAYLWSATPTEYQVADLILPDGGRVHYTRISPGTGYSDAVFEHTASPTRFYKSRIVYNGSGWDLTLRDRTKLVFYDNGPLQSITDRFGNQTLLDRRNQATGLPDPRGQIWTIRSPNGRWIGLHYDASGRIDQATDNAGRTVGYVYNAAGYLWKVTDAFGQVTEYTYDASNRMRTIKDPRLITFLTIDYDANSRVFKQTQADATFFQFDYVVDQNGKVTQTDVTDPRGFKRRTTFNAAGYGLSDTAAFGESVAQTTSYVLDPVSNLVLSATDALGRITQNTYDAYGNVLTTKSLYGTPDEVTTTFTYESSFSELASVKDPLNHITTFGYDTRGNRISETDALLHVTEFAYEYNGQLKSTKNALQKTTTFAYLGADLVSITDPLDRITRRLSDAAGRPVAVTDALGNKTRTSYDALNRVTQVVDPRAGATVFTYDENSNRRTVKDAKLNTTTYTYNAMDRVDSRQDALLRTETYTYDANGNLLTVTDRKGQVTEFQYDALDRQSFAGFGRTGSPPSYSYQSTIAYTTYDAGNRLRVATDSGSGTVSRDYDLLDRLTLETTGQGTVGYQYDLAGRRTQLQVGGQTAVTYGYDNADRLLTITKGSTVVGFGYDNADRRTSLTLPGALSVTYGYDDASQLLSLTYKRSTTTIGDLAYSYDQAGRRATTSGTYARLNLPAALSSAQYDVNNRVFNWGGTTISYDLNGNMAGDGVNTYMWNARDQLSAVTKTGQTLPSFVYDAFGRRQKKILGATVTSYLYDGANVVQELTGASPSANMLTGVGVDEVFQRNEAAVTRTLLSDALGSAIALADTAGVVQTSYAYAPFGAMTFTGTTSTNTSQFTGRENDNDGLFFYRARYYHPVMSRFVSEDPLGFSGGDANLYAYTGSSPTNFNDPSGMILPWLGACVAGAAFSVGADFVRFLMAGGRKENAPSHGSLLASVATGCVGGVLGLGAAKLVSFVRFGRLASKYGLSRSELQEVMSAWNRSTFKNSIESAAYHYGRHGEGQGLLQYTRDAVDFLARNGLKAFTKVLKNGEEGIKINTADYFGIYSQIGKIVSYGPR